MQKKLRNNHRQMSLSHIESFFSFVNFENSFQNSDIWQTPWQTSVELDLNIKSKITTRLIRQCVYVREMISILERNEPEISQPRSAQTCNNLEWTCFVLYAQSAISINFRKTQTNSPFTSTQLAKNRVQSYRSENKKQRFLRDLILNKCLTSFFWQK